MLRSLAPRLPSSVLALGAALLTTGNAAAQTVTADPDAARRFAVAEWSAENGLPSNAVRDIRQTADGYLWLATYEGLVRFDGVAFRSFSETDIPGLRRASFRRLAVDRHGGLWAAGESSGLVRWANGRWKLFTTRDGLPSDRITAVLPDPDGSLWVGTRSGVSRIVGDRVTRVPMPAGEPEPAVTALARGAGDALWIGTVAGGVLHLQGGRLRRVTRREGLGDDRVTALRVGRDGALWVGTFQGVARIAGDSVTRPGGPNAALPSQVNDLREDADGWWLAADNGLFRLAGGGIEAVTRPDGTPFIQVEGLYADREGNLWMASRQAGLLRLRTAAVRMLTARGGLPHDFVTAVTGDRRGGQWIATRGGVVHRTAAGGFDLRYAGETLGDQVARDVLLDRAGVLWIATNGGLTAVRGGRASTLTVHDGLPDDRVRTLF
jgi:ligand-binding sensor domain-containing protein